MLNQSVYNKQITMNQIPQQQSNTSALDPNQVTNYKLTCQPTAQQCRICLDTSKRQKQNNEQFSEYKLISPCKCSGSLKYIHEECLKEWISKIVNKYHKKIKSGKAHINCQLCKAKIYFKVCKEVTCKTREEIMVHFLDNIKSFVLLVLLLLINLGFFSALLNYLLFVGFTILQQNNAVLVSLIISGQVLFSIVAAVTTVCIVNKYLLNRKYAILQIIENGRKETAKTEPNALTLEKSNVDGHEGNEINK